jgi:hypothetical protein
MRKAGTELSQEQRLAGSARSTQQEDRSRSRESSDPTNELFVNRGHLSPGSNWNTKPARERREAMGRHDVFLSELRGAERAAKV